MKKTLKTALVVIGFSCFVFCLSLLKKAKEREFDGYLHKIWIREDFDGVETGKVSFIINKIENNHIEGIFSASNLPDSNERSGSFQGNIKGYNANCSFIYGNGNRGNIQITFTDQEEITAEIVYAADTTYYTKEELSGTFTYKPYQITDMGGSPPAFTENEDLSFWTVLDGWGEVCFVAGSFDTGERTYPRLFLTDGKENILYEFPMYGATGTEIKSIILEDLNGDGRKDIYITSFLTDEPERVEPATDRKMYQGRDGLFYFEKDLFPN